VPSDVFNSGTVTLVLINMVLAWAMWLPLSVGQFAFSTVGAAAIGAYLSAKAGLELGIPFALALLLSFGAGAVFGLLPGLMALRLSAFSYALATLALAEVVRVAIINIPGLGGAYGLVGIVTSDAVLPIAALIMVAIGFLSHRIYRSHTGRLFDLLSQDGLLAQSLGTASGATKVATLALSSGVAAVGGALLAAYTGYLSTDQFGLAFTTQLFAFVIVGGLVTWVGPFFGAALLTLALEWFTSAGTLQNIIFGALLIAVILVRRDGIVGRVLRLQQRRLARILEQVEVPSNVTPRQTAGASDKTG
jgi:branched-chain amino acid transport system permease protein